MNTTFLKGSHASVLALCVALTWQVRGQDQQTFHTPDAATNALVKAAKAHDRQAMREIFGPDVTNFFTGDQALDEKHFDSFANDLAEQCGAVPESNDKVMLEIGHQGRSFPIPLIKTNGVWQFDTIAGEDEIINRHIGQDEYYAIGVCRAYLTAQREYAGRFGSPGVGPKYAMRFRILRAKPTVCIGPAKPIARKARCHPSSPRRLLKATIGTLQPVRAHSTDISSRF